MWTEKVRICVVAAVVFALDQVTKWSVLRRMDFGEEWIVIDGFFKFVLWGNTGAAWSLFHGRNDILAVVSLIALVVLFQARRHFEIHRLAGQIGMGFLLGGILGNVIDRVRLGQVVDFLRFYIDRRGSSEIGFPAFNVADSAICSGVAIFFILSWNSSESRPASIGAEGGGDEASRA